MPNPTNNKLVDSNSNAALFDTTPFRVQQLTNDVGSVAVKLGNANRYDLLPTIQRYIRYLTAKANGREPSKKDSEIEGRRLEAEADLKRSKADIAALQLSELEGTMHRSEDVEAVMTDLVYNIRSMLVALPGRLAVDVTGAATPAAASAGAISAPMTRTTNKAAAKLNTAFAGAVKRFAPPESLTVDEWADKHRRLSPESSAEAGPWRTKRTPYLEEPMRAFTDPKVHKIVMVAASQVGKSELELNIIGYIIDKAPRRLHYVHPPIDDARK